MSSETSAKENENPVSLEYVKKSKTDFDFFPDKMIGEICKPYILLSMWITGA